MTYKTGLLKTMLFHCFQYALPMKSFMRKFSSSNKSLSKILTQKKLWIDVLTIF